MSEPQEQQPMLRKPKPRPDDQGGRHSHSRGAASMSSPRFTHAFGSSRAAQTPGRSGLRLHGRRFPDSNSSHGAARSDIPTSITNVDSRHPGLNTAITTISE